MNLPQNRRNSLPHTARTLRQRSFNQRVGCMLLYVTVLWDWSLDKRKVRDLVPFCGQNGYRAQVPQQPIYSYTHLTSIKYYELCYDLKRRFAPQMMVTYY